MFSRKIIFSYFVNCSLPLGKTHKIWQEFTSQTSSLTHGDGSVFHTDCTERFRILSEIVGALFHNDLLILLNWCVSLRNSKTIKNIQFITGPAWWGGRRRKAGLWSSRIWATRKKEHQIGGFNWLWFVRMLNETCFKKKIHQRIPSFLPPCLVFL